MSVEREEERKRFVYESLLERLEKEYESLSLEKILELYNATFSPEEVAKLKEEVEAWWRDVQDEQDKN